MTHTPERILRNTGIMIGALSVQKLFALFYFALVARWFGAAITGEFFFATSVGMLMTVLLDSGQSALLIRESARDIEHAKEDFRSMLAVKLFLAAVIASVGAIAIRALNVNALLQSFLVLVFFSSMAEALHVSLYGVLRAYQLQPIEAIAGVVGQVITLAVGLLVWRGILPLPMLVGAYLAGNLFHVILAASIVKYRYGFSFLPVRSRSRLGHWISRTSPFAIAAYFTKVGTYTDSVLLRMFGDATSLGIYSVPFKTSFSWLFVPQGLIATLFPAMSFFAHSDRDKLNRSFHRSIELLLLLAAPLAFGIASTAPTFISAIFGANYRQSTPFSQVYAFIIFPLFIQYPVGSLFNATDRAQTYTRLLGIAMATNVALNVLLIPRFGAWGAIASAMASHSILCCLGFAKLRAVVAIDWRRLMRAAAKVILAALLMVVAVAMVSRTPLLVQVLVGGGVYMLLSWLFGSWSAHDVRRLLRSGYAQDVTGDSGVSAE